MRRELDDLARRSVPARGGERLLEQMRESGGTPEEVCATCPELLEQVRAGWQELRALRAKLRALFPESRAPAKGKTGPGRFGKPFGLTLSSFLDLPE
jgi:hypothetical protein